jgi:hypothetical protein
MPFVVRPLRDERTTRGGSNDGVERVGHRHSKTRASSIDDAALTGPSRPATRPAPSEKKNRPHEAAGSGEVRGRAARAARSWLSGLLLPAARRSRPEPAAR